MVVTQLGGDDVSEFLQKRLAERETPFFINHTESETDDEGLRDAAEKKRVIDDIKVKMAFVAEENNAKEEEENVEEVEEEEEEAEGEETVADDKDCQKGGVGQKRNFYRLPDDHVINLDEDCFRCTEMLFKTALIESEFLW